MRVKMIEMMSAGLPIVSTGQGAEGNEAGDGVHFLRADDAASFADAIVRLLRDRDERDRLARAGRTFVEERYALDVVARSLEELLGAATMSRTNASNGRFVCRLSRIQAWKPNVPRASRSSSRLFRRTAAHLLAK